MAARDLHSECRRETAVRGVGHHFLGLLVFLLVASIGWAAEEGGLARIQQIKLLKVCADRDNRPFSTADATSLPGLDVEVAQMLAGRLGVQAQFVWVEPKAMGEALRLLRTGGCDTLMGLPVDQRAIRVRPWLDVTVPYYGTGFILATRKGRPVDATQLGDLQDEVIGVETRTLPDSDLYEVGFKRKQYPSQTPLFQGLERGEVQTAILFAPAAAWLLKQKPDAPVDLAREPLPDPRYRWNVAIGVRKEDWALKQALDKALQELLAGGKVEAILANYGIPFIPPFE